MSDQQSQQGNQPEPQQHDGQAIIRPRPPWPIMQLIYVIIRLTYNAVMDHYAPLYLRTPYHTSSLSGADWVGELLAGHPNRIRNELGVYRGTFLVLTEIMKQAGLQSSRHVSIEEATFNLPLHRSHRVNFHSRRRTVSAVNKYDSRSEF